MIKNQRLYKTRYYSVLCLFVLLHVLLLLFSSCQEESEEIVLPSSDKAILPGSLLGDYISRIALNDGSPDNIVDNASCTRLVFPVMVVVNGQEVEIASADDLSTVEGIIDESDNDQDDVRILFPVTVTLTDHTELVINNAEEFEDLADLCTEGGLDDDIECVDFKYPLTISVYDSDNQVSRVISINDDKELFTLFDNLEEGHIASFTFPVTAIVAGGEMTFTDNHHMEDVIEDYMDDCDEDDDNDHNDDDADDSGLITTLLGGDWKITHYFATTDDTELFADFVITFLDDSTTLSSDGISSISGEWETNGDDGTLVLELELGEEEPFNTMPHKWDVVEFNSALIQLKHLNPEDGSEAAMTLEKI